MEILAFSDCHGKLPDIPDVGHETLCIVGDICPDFRPVGKPAGNASQFQWVKEKFVPWIKAITIKNKVVVFGNHDWFSTVPEYVDELRKLLPDVHFLFDSAVTIDGVNFWGSPRTTSFRGWAWETPEEELKQVYAGIPVNTNVILSHSPPFGDCDNGLGSKALANWVGCNYVDGSTSIRLLLCGHIHEGHGKTLKNKAHSYPLIIANVTLVDREYNTVYTPQDFSVDPAVKWGFSDLRL